MFSGHAKHQHIIYNTVFFINATDKNDPEIERMTQQVIEVAMKQKTWGQPRPMAWVPMELQISKLKSMKFNLVTKEKLLGVNRKNADLALPEKELERFLKVQHSMGKIMYFEEHDLDKFIITQPSALVNILKAFITDKLFWPKDDKLRDILQNVNHTGKIYKEELIRLWNQDQFKDLQYD